MNRLSETEPAMTARPRQAGTFRCSDSLSYRSGGRPSNSPLPVEQVAMAQVLGKLQRTSKLQSFGHRQGPAYVSEDVLGSQCLLLPFPQPDPSVTHAMNKARGREGDGERRGREGGRGRKNPHFRNLLLQGWRDGSADKVPAVQASGPEFRSPALRRKGCV